MIYIVMYCSRHFIFLPLCLAMILAGGLCVCPAMASTSKRSESPVSTPTHSCCAAESLKNAALASRLTCSECAIGPVRLTQWAGRFVRPDPSVLSPSFDSPINLSVLAPAFDPNALPGQYDLPPPRHATLLDLACALNN